MADIFISYSSQDNDVAKALRAYLEAEGYSCWMAPDDVKGPRTYPEQIMSAIEACRAMVILVSQAANDSGHVANEVSAAFDAHKAILPIRVEDVQPARSLAYLLRLQQWVDAFPGPIDRHADELRDSLAALLGAVEELPEVSGKKRPGFMRRLRKRSPSILAIVSLLLVAVLAVVAFGIFQLVNGLSQLQSGPTTQVPGINADDTVVDAGTAKEVKPNPSATAAPGQLNWSLVGDAPFFQPPLVTDRTLYGAMQLNVLAIDAKTGQKTWSAQLGGEAWGSPAISGNTILVTTWNKYLYALDKDSGKPLWKTKVEITPQVDTPVQLSEPIAASGLAVFGSADGMLRAVDVATGQQRWKLMVAHEFDEPHARFADGVVVFASAVPSVGAVDPSTGELLWRTDLNAGFDGFPCIDSGIAFFRTEGMMYAFDLKTGDQRWSTEAEAWGGAAEGILPSPAAGSGIVCYPGEGNSLVALDAATGKRVWRFEAKGPIAPPAIGQGMVCFGSQDSFVYGLDAKTGKLLWKCTAGELLISQTILRAGVAYVGGDKNGLFAVQASK